MSTYVVVLQEQGIPYGPFADEGTAEKFACFLRSEVDPAYVRRLHSPVPELLAWYESEQEQDGSGTEDEDAHDAAQETPAP